MIVYDADGQILGRLCSHAAKQALLGQEVIVVNAEKAIVSGEKPVVLTENLEKLKIKNKGNYRAGPFHQKRPDRYVRRKIRGMLPYEKTRGREAFKRVQVYIGVPENVLKDNHGVDLGKTELVKPSDSDKKVRRGLTVKEICKAIGGNW